MVFFSMAFLSSSVYALACLYHGCPAFQTHPCLVFSFTIFPLCEACCLLSPHFSPLCFYFHSYSFLWAPAIVSPLPSILSVFSYLFAPLLPILPMLLLKVENSSSLILMLAASVYYSYSYYSKHMKPRQ